MIAARPDEASAVVRTQAKASRTVRVRTHTAIHARARATAPAQRLAGGLGRSTSTIGRGVGGPIFVALAKGLGAKAKSCGTSTVRCPTEGPRENSWEGDAGLAAAAVAAAEPARGGQGAEVPLRAHREACLDCRQLLWCAGCACVCLDAVPTAPRGPPLRWEASSECLSLRVACHRRALLLQ